ncbi:M1 family metallopeptidase [Kaarinaea lacus]
MPKIIAGTNTRLLRTRLLRVIFGVVLVIYFCTACSSKTESGKDSKDSAATSETTIDLAHYSIQINLNPEQSTLEVTSTIDLPGEVIDNGVVKFLLHEHLQVASPQAKIQKHAITSPAFKKLAETADVPLVQYEVKLADQSSTLQLNYQGKIHHALDETHNTTPGLISPDGVFLARSTAWYPIFNDSELFSFDLNIQVPQGWGAVSQGALQSEQSVGQQRSIHWVEQHPQDDIYIVASQYQEYQQSIDGTTAMVFLRDKDDALAQKYIKATGQYIAMYNELIGPYPYQKFALVENFWETGYGMPSFTLLGPRVIRFPFIIYTSYPHEILHNYWGNGVFVEYESGNWSEGLTAYLADHLLKEQRGQGAEYRRSVLQKYTDFVNESRDFALTEFRSRHSSASEAVGYGKTLMLFHMLRLQLGDETFKQALRALYERHKFAIASFSDVQAVFSSVAGSDLSALFAQWVDQAGAPHLEISDVDIKAQNSGYRVSFKLNQLQEKPTYQLNVPVRIYLAGDKGVVEKLVAITDKQHTVTIAVPEKPVLIDVDPAFDVFRRLDSREIPSAISQGFGDDRPLLVLPAKEDPARLAAYVKLAKQWQQRYSQQMEIINESELKELPADRSIWLVGWNNKFRDQVIVSLEDQKLKVTQDSLHLGDKSYTKDKHAFLATTRHPKNREKTLLWLSSDNTKAIPGLTRKLPHYRNYSYLVFEGDEPKNIVKGQWDVNDSPMRVVLDKGALGAFQKPTPRMALVPP